MPTSEPRTFEAAVDAEIENLYTRTANQDGYGYTQDQARAHVLAIIDFSVEQRMLAAINDADEAGLLSLPAHDWLDRRARTEGTANKPAEPIVLDPLDGNPHDMSAGEDYDTDDAR